MPENVGGYYACLGTEIRRNRPRGHRSSTTYNGGSSDIDHTSLPSSSNSPCCLPGDDKAIAGIDVGADDAAAGKKNNFKEDESRERRDSKRRQTATSREIKQDAGCSATLSSSSTTTSSATTSSTDPNVNVARNADLLSCLPAVTPKHHQDSERRAPRERSSSSLREKQERRELWHTCFSEGFVASHRAWYRDFCRGGGNDDPHQEQFAASREDREQIKLDVPRTFACPPLAKFLEAQRNAEGAGASSDEQEQDDDHGEDLQGSSSTSGGAAPVRGASHLPPSAGGATEGETKTCTSAGKNGSSSSSSRVTPILNNNGIFAPENIQAALSRVLLAFATRTRSVAGGFSQGQNFLAAAILLGSGLDEELAFVSMCFLVARVLPDDYYASDLFGLRVESRCFATIAVARLVNLHRAVHGWTEPPSTAGWASSRQDEPGESAAARASTTSTTFGCPWARGIAKHLGARGLPWLPGSVRLRLEAEGHNFFDDDFGAWEKNGNHASNVALRKALRAACVAEDRRGKLCVLEEFFRMLAVEWYCSLFATWLPVSGTLQLLDKLFAFCSDRSNMTPCSRRESIEKALDVEEEAAVGQGAPAGGERKSGAPPRSSACALAMGSRSVLLGAQEYKRGGIGIAFDPSTTMSRSSSSSTSGGKSANTNLVDPPSSRDNSPESKPIRASTSCPSITTPEKCKWKFPVDRARQSSFVGGDASNCTNRYDLPTMKAHGCEEDSPGSRYGGRYNCSHKVDGSTPPGETLSLTSSGSPAAAPNAPAQHFWKASNKYACMAVLHRFSVSWLLQHEQEIVAKLRSAQKERDSEAEEDEDLAVLQETVRQVLLQHHERNDTNDKNQSCSDVVLSSIGIEAELLNWSRNQHVLLCREVDENAKERRTEVEAAASSMVEPQAQLAELYDREDHQDPAQPGVESAAVPPQQHIKRNPIRQQHMKLENHDDQAAQPDPYYHLVGPLYFSTSTNSHSSFCSTTSTTSGKAKGNYHSAAMIRGWCEKQSPSLFRDWKQRFLVLEKGLLSWFKDVEGWRKNEPRNSLDLMTFRMSLEVGEDSESSSAPTGDEKRSSTASLGGVGVPFAFADSRGKIGNGQEDMESRLHASNMTRRKRKSTTIEGGSSSSSKALAEALFGGGKSGHVYFRLFSCALKSGGGKRNPPREEYFFRFPARDAEKWAVGIRQHLEILSPGSWSDE